MPLLADAGVPLLVHAELAGPDRRGAPPSGKPQRRRAHAVRALARVAPPGGGERRRGPRRPSRARDRGARAHVVHLSSADAIARASALARDAGARVSAETCPHYLVFAAEDVPDGATEYKCAPPIRERHNRERLWQALARGGRLAGRDGSLAVAGRAQVHRHRGTSRAPGAASRRWSSGSRRRGPRRARAGSRCRALVEWMCAAPARLVGLDDRKGSIAAGKDADLVVWDPDGERVVDASRACTSGTSSRPTPAGRSRGSCTRPTSGGGRCTLPARTSGASERAPACVEGRA